MRTFCAGEHGNAVTEFALVIPMLLVIFFSIFEIARYTHTLQETSFFSREVTNLAYRYCAINPPTGQVTPHIQPGCLTGVFEGLPEGAALLTQMQTISPNIRIRVRVIRGNTVVSNYTFPIDDLYGRDVDVDVTQSNRLREIRDTNGVIVVGEVATRFGFLFPRLLPEGLQTVYVPTMF